MLAVVRPSRQSVPEETTVAGLKLLTPAIGPTSFSTR